MNSTKRYYQRLSGRGNFYDYNSQLNYFDYFGIDNNDIKIMFDLLKKNEYRIKEFYYELEEKIFQRISFYSSHIRDAKSGFIKLSEQKKIQSGNAFICSMIYLGSRLLAQEFVLLTTVNRSKFNVDLKVFKFGEEKYNYRLYLKSLRTFFESLSSWSYAIIKNDFEHLLYFSKMDNFVDQKIYDLKAYKDLFMLIWMQSYAMQAKEMNSYNLYLDQKSETFVKVNYNVLNPLDFSNLFRSSDELRNYKKTEFISDYNIWMDQELKQSVVDNRENIYNSVAFTKELSLNDYLDIVNIILSSFEYYNIYEYESYINGIYDTLLKKYHNKISFEFVQTIIEKMIYINDQTKKSNIYKDFYQNGVYKKSLLYFKDSRKTSFILGFAEMIYMNFYAHKNWMNFEEPYLSDFNQQMNKKLNELMYETLKVVKKRFSVIELYKPNDIPLFEPKSNNKKSKASISHVDAIAYEKNINTCYFFINNFFNQSPEPYDIYKCGLQVYKGLNNIIDRIVKPKLSIILNDYKKIIKQLKIPKNANFAMVLVVNDLLQVEPRVILDNNIKLFIVAYPTLEYFLTSFIYKK
ncbi:hypothetical protein SGLAD_v1c06860 [Spiroplasma gladiatoris]|uniref:Uncharacterized protein n=1 Tax=Spiroplasma gladiatoris TaxID=2143 RepID=A0A4P7AHF9_9MOLU|nr:hypothetical protein [Spiroplasma gladiatoris]QBQ07885.1 hypothetical protein SGLAD_v1c06860 [Spiroplasma gladiatoris]